MIALASVASEYHSLGRARARSLLYVLVEEKLLVVQQLDEALNGILLASGSTAYLHPWRRMTVGRGPRGDQPPCLDQRVVGLYR
jgi:hypothetical protein